MSSVYIAKTLLFSNLLYAERSRQKGVSKHANRRMRKKNLNDKRNALPPGYVILMRTCFLKGGCPSLPDGAASV